MHSQNTALSMGSQMSSEDTYEGLHEGQRSAWLACSLSFLVTQTIQAVQQSSTDNVNEHSRAASDHGHINRTAQHELVSLRVYVALHVRIWVHTLSVSCCIIMGGRSSCAFTPRATDMTARAHSMRCTRFRCRSMNCVGGRWKAGSCFRMLNKGKNISDQCPMAVCMSRDTSAASALCGNLCDAIWLLEVWLWPMQSMRAFF